MLLAVKVFAWVALAILAATAPLILSDSYQRELLIMTAIYGIATLSLDMVMGEMGQFSFGHAAIWGIGGYTSAILSLRFGIPVWAAMLAAIVFTGVLGLALSYVPLLRTRGLELAIITFAFGAILTRAATAMHDITGGPAGLLGIPAPVIFGKEFSDELSTYYLVLGALVLSLYFVYRFKKSRLGRAVRSIRENEDLAKSIGISPTRYYVATFGLSSGLIGFSGALYAHHLGFITPNSLGLTYMVAMVIMVIIGGSGSLLGPIVGAVIYVWGTELLRDLSEELRFLFFGMIMLAIVVFLPRGVVPTLRSVWVRYLPSTFIGVPRRAAPND